MLGRTEDSHSALQISIHIMRHSTSTKLFLKALLAFTPLPPVLTDATSSTVFALTTFSPVLA